MANIDANALGCADVGGGDNDTIVFANTGIDPVLTIAPVNADDNQTGDIDVEATPATDGTLTIQGLGRDETTIQGGVGAALGPDRLIDVEDGTLTITGLSLAEGDTDGAEDGGGIRATFSNAATDVLTLDDAAVTNNVSAGAGGGLYVNDGTLNLTDSTLAGNTAEGAGGGGAFTGGGAKVSITGSTVATNHATGAGGDGGGLYVSGAESFSLASSEVSSNDTGAAPDASDGGGIFFSSGAITGTVTGSTISGNEANGGVGGGFGGGISHNNGTIAVTDSTISGNDARVGGGMGGLGTFNLLRTSVTGNVAEVLTAGGAAAGGGLHNLADSTVTDSTISNNMAVEVVPAASQLQGAGISNGNNDIRVTGSTISGNSFDGPPAVSFGAGLTSAGGSNVDLVNSTVSGNSESGTGSTLQGFGGGTAIVDIVHSTITGNTFAPGRHSFEFFTGASLVTVRGSILTDPSACGDTVLAATSTYNVDAGSSCPVGTGSLSNTNPLIGPLGPTGLHALAASSPALDLVPAGACLDATGAPLLRDQRGAPRPSPTGGRCDAGSFELSVVSNLPRCRGLTATITSTSGPDVIVGTPGRDVIAGLGGRDVIRGLGGNDVACGGPGKDTLRGGKGNDRLLGEAGKDKLFGGAGRDKLIGGGSKRDLCNGGGGRDRKAKGCETRRKLP